MPRAALRFASFAGLALSLTACSLVPDWFDSSPKPISRTPGERVNVVSPSSKLEADPALKDVEITVPEQANVAQWSAANIAMETGHVGLTGIGREDSARIGDGQAFSRITVSAPVVAQGMVFAMDAAGVVSAHDEADISTVKWTDASARHRHIQDVLGGGLAYENGVLYATSGLGNLRALAADSGEVRWSIQVGAPVRGAPAVASGLVVVLTADNQTLAYDATNGQLRWEHRGIRETAGYYSITAPVLSGGIVVSAYSSGEVFALRLETGSVLWSDSLMAGVNTRASAAFSGIDADPIVQEGVVVVSSVSGVMQASALLNGRPLWQAPIGSHNMPWSAGNVLYVLTSHHDLAAVMKGGGGIRWAVSLAQADARDPSKDKTPPLYGPILSANAVLVIDGNGTLRSFKPTTGEAIGSYDLREGVISNPVVAGGAMYLITKDARLWKFY